ncbi:MAG: MHYT domain-containing protein [Gemmatimonadales bacterium]|nr:MHYT domain-containing protein [Gemmatimonadales bacterium]
MTLLAGRYDPALVALSVLIAILAAGAALDLASRVTAARGRLQVLWLAGGALAMGLGIWSMHYTGMLAFHLPVPVFYHVPTVALSLLAAVVASGVALYTASRERLTIGRGVAGSLIMGSGIAAMHYIGMSAMRLAAAMRWNNLLVAASIGIAVLVAAVALWLAFHYGHAGAELWTSRKVASAIVMGLAIPAMHYTGMAAATFRPAPVPVDPVQTIAMSVLGAWAIGTSTLLVLAMAIATALISRYGEERLRALTDKLTEAQAIAHIGSWDWDIPASRVTWSAELYRIYGLPPATPPSYDAIVARVHPDDRARVDGAIARCISDGGAVTYEWRVMRPDGTTGHVQSRAIAVVNAARQVVRLVGTSLDITERKLAEENQRTLVRELQASVAEIKVLKGILPICASCKRIRDGDGRWEAVESYVRDHTNAEFSHGLCPDCAARDWGT